MYCYSFILFVLCYCFALQMNKLNIFRVHWTTNNRSMDQLLAMSARVSPFNWISTISISNRFSFFFFFFVDFSLAVHCYGSVVKIFYKPYLVCNFNDLPLAQNGHFRCSFTYLMPLPTLVGCCCCCYCCGWCRWWWRRRRLFRIADFCVCVRHQLDYYQINLMFVWVCMCVCMHILMIRLLQINSTHCRTQSVHCSQL